MLQVDGQVLINGGDGNNKAIIRARNVRDDQLWQRFESCRQLRRRWIVDAGAVKAPLPASPWTTTWHSRNAKACCGLQVIDLDSGDIVHWLRIDGSIQELYDVAVLPGVRQPKALGFLTNEIQHHVSLPNN
ncbi:MAG: DUF4915 domain-containing protein [Pirellulaceae bacterium]